MDVETNLRVITKNHAAAPEIRFLTTSISQPFGRATAMPTAWEVNNQSQNLVTNKNISRLRAVLERFVRFDARSDERWPLLVLDPDFFLKTENVQNFLKISLNST